MSVPLDNRGAREFRPAATMTIAEIKIGHRARRDPGDIGALAASIAEVGLLHPVVIRKGGTLIAGQRRIQAFRRLGRTEIPVTILDVEAIARGELAENAVRKDFTPSELVAISRTVEIEERRLAKKRQGARTDKHPAKLAEGSNGRSRDRVAARIGAKPTTLAKACAVVDAASVEPEKYRALVDDMDRTGKVNGAFKRLQVARQAEAIKRSPPPLPGGPFGVIVADPPWPYEVRQLDPSHRAVNPYPSLSIAQICAVPVRDLAAVDSILWLWTTNHHMRQAFDVLDAWDFRPATILTWAKDKVGLGHWLRGQTEHCLLATRGKPIVTMTKRSTLLSAPAREHSQKPDEFFRFVESLCPAPPRGYLSLFERQHRENWVVWGDEITVGATDRGGG